jgi:hypothetical protein
MSYVLFCPVYVCFMCVVCSLLLVFVCSAVSVISRMAVDSAR